MDADDRPLLLERLLPAAPPADAAEVVETFGLWERSESPPARPRTLLNMVASLDGHATVDGRSGPLGDRADRELFHALRAAVDGVLVGAGTVRTERYGRMIGDPETRALRARRGLTPEPLACIVSGRLQEPLEAPLLDEPQARVAILTATQASLPQARASVEYVRGEGGRLDLAAAMRELAERFGVQTLLCEGGPHLAHDLMAAELLDELFVSLSPTLVSGTGLSILAGSELRPAPALELLGALRHDSSLFLRYGVSVSA